MRAALVALACAGCYAPHYPEGLTCATGSEPCPPTQTCGGDNHCHSSPDAQAIDGGPPVDGTPGSWVNERSSNDDLRGVWGEPGVGVFAVGARSVNGLILQRDGSGGWTPTTKPVPLNAIGGRGTTIWTVGVGGDAWQFAGAAWIQRAIGGADLNGVSFQTTELGAAVGASAKLLVYDASGFHPVTLGSTANFAAVTMAIDSANVDFLVGDQTAVMYDGTNPTTLPPHITGPEHYVSVWGGKNELYVGSDQQLLVLATLTDWTASLAVGCAGLDGDANGTVWCASNDGVYRGGKSQFSRDAASPHVPFTAIHVVGDNVYAVGPSGAIWRRTSLD